MPEEHRLQCRPDRAAPRRAADSSGGGFGSDIRLTACGASAPACEGAPRIDTRPAAAGGSSRPQREPQPGLRDRGMRHPNGPDDGSPWWVAAILVAIFGIAMFLSGLIVGHHLG